MTAKLNAPSEEIRRPCHPRYQHHRTDQFRAVWFPDAAQSKLSTAYAQPSNQPTASSRSVLSLQHCFGGATHDSDRNSSRQQPSQHERSQPVQTTGNHRSLPGQLGKRFLHHILSSHRERCFAASSVCRFSESRVCVAPAQHERTSTPRGASSYASASPSAKLNALVAP